MNSKNTWTLVALAALLFAFIYFYERRLDLADQSGVKSRQLLEAFHAASVARIEIQDEGRSLTVIHTNDVWRLVAPVNYPASQGRILSLLEACEKMAWSTRITARELAAQPRGLADFGLQPAQATLLFEQGRDKYEVRIGAKTPVGDQLYVQLGDRNEVYLVAGALLESLPAAVDDWRDRTLLNLRNLAYNRLEVRSGARGFEFQRDTNKVWRLTKPQLFRADNAKLNYLLQQIELWPVQKFVTDDPRADLDRFGLHPPDLELIFGQGTNELLTAQFGGSPTNNPASIYVRRLSHTNIVTAPKEWFELLRGSSTDFRDRRLLSLSRITNIDQVEVRSREPFTLRRQADGHWLALESTNVPVDARLVNDFLLNLAELEVVEFFKDVNTDQDYASHGLANPAWQYTLSSSVTNAGAAPTNEVVGQVDFGATEGGAVFARRSDEDSIYKVAAVDLQRLPRALYQLRDRAIWNFAATNVTTITVEQAGATRKLVRNAKGVWTFAPGSQGIINALSVEDALHGLGQLRAETWIGRGPADVARFVPPELARSITLEVLREGKSTLLNLTFGKLDPSRSPYATALVDGEQLVFVVPQSVYLDTLRDLTVPVPAKTQ